MSDGWPDDLDPLEESLLARRGELRPVGPAPLDPLVAATLFESQVASRLLDHTARWLRADGHRRNPGTTADLVAAALFILLVEGRLPWPVQFY